MNKIRPIIFAFLALLTVSVKAVEAGPMLKLSNADVTPTNGGTFKVILSVDSGTAKSIGVDAWMTFDSTKLEVVSIESVPVPAFSYSMGKNIFNTTGMFDISFNADANTGSADAAVAKGDLALITFKALSTGVADVKFTCITASTKDTNIFDTNATDVIDCASNINGSYTINASSGGSTNPTSTPTTVVNNVTSAPGELPKTGGFETTIGLMIFGLVGALAGVALKWL